MSSALFNTNIGFLHDFANIYYNTGNHSCFPCHELYGPCSNSNQLFQRSYITHIMREASRSHAKDLILTRICVSRLSVLRIFEGLTQNLCGKIFFDFFLFVKFYDTKWPCAALIFIIKSTANMNFIWNVILGIILARPSLISSVFFLRVCAKPLWRWASEYWW